jgi:hypothetical protein
MTALTLEAFLARIYLDEKARARFLENPQSEATIAGLSPQDVEAVTKIDRVGLELLAISLERKRKRRCEKRPNGRGVCKK